MTNPCGNHRHAVCITIVDAFLVANRSSGLNHTGYSSIIGDLHTVRKWEEGIRSHGGSFKPKTKALRFLYRLVQSINT